MYFRCRYHLLQRKSGHCTRIRSQHGSSYPRLVLISSWIRIWAFDLGRLRRMCARCVLTIAPFPVALVRRLWSSDDLPHFIRHLYSVYARHSSCSECCYDDRVSVSSFSRAHIMRALNAFNSFFAGFFGSSSLTTTPAIISDVSRLCCTHDRR